MHRRGHHRNLPLPKKIMAHGWLLFEESKMSKSRGNIVRSETILDVLGADALNAIAYYVLQRGDSVTARGPTSLVMRYRDGRWFIVHDHSS